MNSNPVDRGPISEAMINEDFAAFELLLARQGVELDPEQKSRLLAYGRFVHERSALLNLISPADRGRFFSRHVTESLHPRLIELLGESGSLVDIGTGAGLPGIPLAIACPDARVLLVEPRQRKAQFLEAAVQKLGLASRAEIYQGTADKLVRASGAELGAAMATARAVDRLAPVWEWACGLLRPGGWLATFKGPDEVAGELESIEGEFPEQAVTLPVEGQPRVLLLLQRRQGG